MMWWRVIKTIGEILGLLVIMMGKLVLGILAAVALLLVFLAHFVGGPRL